MQKPEKKITFKFFDYKWDKVPTWASDTEKIYRQWYLERYGHNTLDNLSLFLKDKKRILEAGCGLARDSKMFAELNPTVEIIAMDQSEQALKIAKKTLDLYDNCKVVRDDITNFKIMGKFDFISCDQVLHHTPDLEKTLSHLYSYLTIDGVLNFSVCRKKNKYRDFVDDLIMEHARTLSPEKLWEFSEIVTRFGKAIYELEINNVSFDKKKYVNLQRFVHDHVFRCWYNPEIDFDLSVSSNYDWFSENPRFNSKEVEVMMSQGLGPYDVLRFYKDNATISVSIKKVCE